MKSFLLADRYARGLDSLVTDGAQADELAKAFSELAQAYEGSRELQDVLANPALPESVRLSILDEFCTRSGAQALLGQLAATLLKRHRIGLLPAVADLFAARTDERLNRVEADVTSAAPLTKAQAAQIAQALETYTGKHVRIECAVDPGLLGGVTARIHDLILDGSVRSRIERLQQFLLPEEKPGG